jgi:hypothetical protein
LKGADGGWRMRWEWVVSQRGRFNIGDDDASLIEDAAA